VRNDGYLVKPLRRARLYDGLVRVLQGKTVERENKVREPNNTESLALRVLLVEDTLANQQVAIAMLRKLGCTVVLASDGAEAVELTEQQDFDLVLMDCQMPGVDGYQATGMIRAREAQQGISSDSRLL
jgi:PleD family two-component response regulator